MITIHSPSNNWKERNYIIDIIFNEFINTEYLVKEEMGSRNYEIILDNKNKLIIQDHFFSKFDTDLEYLSINNFPGKIEFIKNRFLSEKDLPVIFGTPEFEIKEKQSGYKEIICGIDIFASAFFMLTRWEEYVSKEKDDLQRFSGKSSIAFRNNFLHRPVVNEYSELLWNMLQFLGLQVTRKSRKFTPYLTHDVDFILKWYNLYAFLRTLSGDLLKRKSIRAFFGNIADYLKTRLKLKNDPFDTFDYLMNLSESNGLKSYFFFISDYGTSKSINYKLSHPFVGNLMQNITSRGHYIGFHPDFNSYNNPDNWSKELDRLKLYSPQNIQFGRQHYLQFEVPVTWQIWNDMGMEWDSSLSYDDEPGFRTGSCYTYSVFNFLTREKLRLKERSLTIMDKSLVFHHINLSVSQLEEKARNLVSTVKKYNGDFVLLWHNSCFDVYEWKKYKEIYLRIIESFKN
jgi:hypothetical protein